MLNMHIHASSLVHRSVARSWLLGAACAVLLTGCEQREPEIRTGATFDFSSLQAEKGPDSTNLPLSQFGTTDPAEVHSRQQQMRVILQNQEDILYMQQQLEEQRLLNQMLRDQNNAFGRALGQAVVE
ncbi:MAG: hypothetical protein ACK6D5_22085 [Planctomyces sp.]